MPAAPTIWAATWVAYARSPAGPVETSPKNSSSATWPPNAIWISARSSARPRVKTSSRSPWASMPSASPRLTMVSTSSRRCGATSQAIVACPASWVAISSTLVLGVLDGRADADLSGEPGRLDVLPVHLVVAAAHRVDQRLVQQVLELGGRPAGRDGGQRVAVLGVVELRAVGALDQEVVDELTARRLGRQVEGEPAVEAARTQQRRVERVGPVGRGDDQHVGLGRARLGDLTVRPAAPG